jgi:hypothetical protein
VRPLRIDCRGERLLHVGRRGDGLRKSRLIFSEKIMPNNRRRGDFSHAMEIISGRRLEGWSFRLFQRGAAQQSPIVILAPAATPPDDPMTAERLVPIETFEGVYRALAGALEAHRSVAFVCSVGTVAADLIGRLFAAGALPAEAAL